jgi:hypothetical protein
MITGTRENSLSEAFARLLTAQCDAQADDEVALLACADTAGMPNAYPCLPWPPTGRLPSGMGVSPTSFLPALELAGAALAAGSVLDVLREAGPPTR